MDIIDSITSVKEIATLPTIATKLIKLLDEDDVNIRDVVRIIEFDPSITMKILKVANSPIYTSYKEISTINDAILLIGTRKLSNILLGVSIYSLFWLSSNKQASDLMYKFWFHSSTTGTIAKKIVKILNRDYHENEFVGGLLHQIGRLAMIQYNLEAYKKVISAIESDNIPNYEAENYYYGVSHFDVGKRMAEHWQLPKIYHSIIENYTHPAQVTKNRELVASVGFAGLLSELNGADFYMGRLPENPEEDESWSILCEQSDSLKKSGIDLLKDEIITSLNFSAEFLESIKN